MQNATITQEVQCRIPCVLSFHRQQIQYQTARPEFNKCTAKHYNIAWSRILCLLSLFTCEDHFHSLCHYFICSSLCPSHIHYIIHCICRILEMQLLKLLSLRGSLHSFQHLLSTYPHKMKSTSQCDIDKLNIFWGLRKVTINNLPLYNIKQIQHQLVLRLEVKYSRPHRLRKIIDDC